MGPCGIVGVGVPNLFSGAPLLDLRSCGGEGLGESNGSLSGAYLVVFSRCLLSQPKSRQKTISPMRRLHFFRSRWSGLGWGCPGLLWRR